MARFSIMLVAAALATIAGLNSRAGEAYLSRATSECDLEIRASQSSDRAPANDTESSMQSIRYAPVHNGMIEWFAKFKVLATGSWRCSATSDAASLTVDAQLAQSVSPRSLQQFAVRLQI